MSLLRTYLKRTLTYSTPRFIFEAAIVSSLLQILIIYSLLFLTNLFNYKIIPPEAPETSGIFIFVTYCIIAPIWETIVFQWLPIKLLKKLTSNIFLIISVTSILFTALHWWAYGFPMFINILPAAIILAWSFFVYYRKSFVKAFWVTAIIHMLGNLPTAMTFILN